MMSDYELSALARTAAIVVGIEDKYGEFYVSPEASEDEKHEVEESQRKNEAENAERRQKALHDFSSALNERIANAYHTGESSAVDRADRHAWNARSVTLYLVVLAVVAMPAIAMATKLNPQTFGSYIAPVTGIAGTVVGYWFGALSRSGGRNSS